MSTIELPSGTIEYEAFGPADSPHPPIVFVHGVVIDGRLWHPVAQLLADKGFRSYAPTLPLGSHTIPWGPAADRSPAGAGRLVREFVTALDLHDVTLVGCDTGGAICQFALDQDPTFVSRVVFTNCDSFEQFPPKPFQVVFTLLKHPWVLKNLGLPPLRIQAIRHSMLGVGMLISDPDPELSASVFEPLRTDRRIREDLAAFIRAINPNDLAAITPRLTRFDGPVTVAWGNKDRAFTTKLGRRLAGVFPDARFVEVPDSLTFVSLDQPAALAEEISAITRRRIPAHED